MKNWLLIHLVILPRWFALPFSLSSIALGGIIGGGINLWTLIVGSLVMAGAHSFNSFLDREWTKLDTEIGGSKSKLYTSGQSVFSTPSKAIFINALSWYILSAAVAIPLGLRHPSVIIFWLLLLTLTFHYSWAKLHWHPEIPLGLGFGPLAVALGNAASPDPTIPVALLAGIPMAILFGGAAELIDQWQDAEVNYPKGLRSLGVLAWVYDIPSELTLLLVGLTLTSVIALGISSILSMTAVVMSFASFPFLLWCGMNVKVKSKAAIIVGLFGIFLFGLLLAVGEYLG